MQVGAFGQRVGITEAELAGVIACSIPVILADNKTLVARCGLRDKAVLVGRNATEGMLKEHG